MAKDTDNVDSVLLPDEPLKSASQDRLDRSRFARGLARHLRRYDQLPSLVVALYGPWGSGKSSLLNMIAESLKNASEDDRPIVVWFNPWHFTTIEQLITAFFKSIRSAIGKKESSKVVDSISFGLEALGLALSAGSLSPWGGNIFSKASTLVKNIKNWIQGKSHRLERTPDEIKEEINGYLDDFGKRVVVFIDDIDRLENDAVLLILRLLRLNASFSPNPPKEGVGLAS